MLSIPFHSSVRIKLSGGSQIKDSAGNVIGINVKATTEKNKLARPRRNVEFAIHFGQGIVESEQIYEVLAKACKDNSGVVFNGKTYIVEGSSVWKVFSVISEDGEVMYTKKFTKAQVEEMLNDPETGPHLDDMLEAVYTSASSNTEESGGEE
jgi:hypothetical protein